MEGEEPTSKASDIWAQWYQKQLDRISSPWHILPRWIAFGVLIFIYFARVYTLGAFYIVTYGLGIYLLNQLIGFISPKFDPEFVEEEGLGGGLPTTFEDAGKSHLFFRKVPEFDFWHSSVRAVLISFFLTFFSIVDIPVFWPILVMYFIVLFFITMKKQIQHMIKYKYIPISFGKPKPGAGAVKSNK